MITPQPSTNTRRLALLVGASYDLNNDNRTRSENENAVEEKLNKAFDMERFYGRYTLQKNVSDANIALFINETQKEAVIAYRGTSFKGKNKNIMYDLLADATVALNNTISQSSMLMSRINQTKDLIAYVDNYFQTKQRAKKNKFSPGSFYSYYHKQRQPSDGTHDAASSKYRIILTGHSLGGSIAYAIASESSEIMSRCSNVHVFNPGTTPLQNIQNQLGYAIHFSFSRFVHIHVVVGDLISSNAEYLEGQKHYYNVKKNSNFFQTMQSFMYGFVPMYTAVEKVKKSLQAHSLCNFY